MKVTTRDLNAFISILRKHNKHKRADSLTKELMLMVNNSITEFELDEINGTEEEKTLASLLKDAEECLRYLKRNDRK